MQLGGNYLIKVPIFADVQRARDVVSRVNVAAHLALGQLGPVTSFEA